jgi:putative endonuclease
MDNKTVGLAGEQEALSYLRKKGFKILETNYKTCFGEVDIIAKDKDDLVFIEVKLRNTDSFGKPEDAVGSFKKTRIVKSALSYIKRKNLYDINVRFDVLVIEPELDRIELIESAFDSSVRYTF